jgi:hypothetical protein
MNIVPERFFTFRISLKGSENSNEVVEENTEPSGNIIAQNEDAETEDVNVESGVSKYYFYFIAVVLIVLTSIIIYKKM